MSFDISNLLYIRDHCIEPKSINNKKLRSETEQCLRSFASEHYCSISIYFNQEPTQKFPQNARKVRDLKQLK